MAPTSCKLWHENRARSEAARRHEKRCASVLSATLQRAALESKIRALFPLTKFPKRMKLLGGSTKTELGKGVGVLTAVCYLLPGNLSGIDLCTNRTRACTAACLGTTSGRMIMSGVRAAQAWKSLLWNEARAEFLGLAELEIQALAKKAKKLGMIPAARWNGSSDTEANLLLASVMKGAGVQSYEYTKDTARALLHAGDDSSSIALSYTGEPANVEACKEVLAHGGRVAVIFDGKLPKAGRFLGAPVVDGDAHDAIFLQPRGSVLALKMKGQTIKRLRGRTPWIVPSWRLELETGAIVGAL